MTYDNAADAIQYQGPLREQALKRFAQQMEQWELALPRNPPLVLDFGQGDFYRVGLIETWIVNDPTIGYCGKYMFLFDGQRCAMHSHAQKHETFFVIKGAIRANVNGEKIDLNPGQTLPLAPGSVHDFQANGNALILELSTPADPHDNRFEHPASAVWLTKNLR